MKHVTVPALIVALGSTMIAAPQAGTKKAPAVLTPAPKDTKPTTAKHSAKPKTKRVKKDAKDKVTHEAHK